MSSKNNHEKHRERLRRRFESEGADSLETHELLELFLFDVIPRANTNPIAHRLLDRFGSLDGVFRASADDLRTVKGVGIVTAEYIINCWNSFCKSMENQILTSPMVSFEQAANYLIWHMFTYFPDKSGTRTIILLNKDMRVVFVSDINEKDALPQKDKFSDAENIIVGVRAGENNDSVFEPPPGLHLRDVILTDGFNAKSILSSSSNV